jgi:tRNA threonylcarbamoyladenosine biosynthesis protein TsaE
MAEIPPVHTASVEATQAVAAELAAFVSAGDVIVLGGDLGAGKTAFTQGLGAALGVSEPIVSPTFTIERIYDGRVRLHHLDVYRLEHLHEALDLDLAEALDDGDVAVVEWGEAISGVLGRDYLLVRLALGSGDDDRIITFEPHGPAWQARAGALGACVHPTPSHDPSDPTGSSDGGAG